MPSGSFRVCGVVMSGLAETAAQQGMAAMQQAMQSASQGAPR